MNSPLVSVIVPVYNGARYLADTIQSILDQDYEPIEIIVVDDGSTDESGEIARSYPEVRYLYQENQGPSVARNTGIRESNGDFLAFLDADDLWTKDKIHVQLEYLMQHPEIGIVFCHHRILIEDNVEKPPWYRPHLHDQDSPVLGATALLARKSVFDVVGLYDPAFRFGENAEWLTRTKDAGISRFILPETLVTLRVHDKNATYHLKEMRSSILKALKSSIDRQRSKKS